MEEQYLNKIKELETRLSLMESLVSNLNNVLKSPRVQIDNLEGIFKTLSSAPDVADYRDGSLVLYESGTTRKIYAKINGAFYSATIT